MGSGGQRVLVWGFLHELRGVVAGISTAETIAVWGARAAGDALVSRPDQPWQGAVG